MLSFISFWRGAAIVLSDLASSAFYAGGIAEGALGRSAPWFVLAVMLFSYAVCALYIESSSMFVRGGVYRVVKEAMGGTLAKFSVSALLFDYVLTGPISAVSAGLYLAGFIKEIGDYAHHQLRFNDNYFAAGFAATVMRQDLHFTAASRINYMPVVFPGFSNRNLRGGRTQLNAIPRECGRFLRSQIANALNEGARTLYVAMFDELNEGTAIMKIEARTTDIPPGAPLLASDQDGCLEPNDLYLRITGEGATLLSTLR